jgi:cytidylate kinase
MTKAKDKKVKRTNLVVAIDGPAGAGKSTVAQRVADTLGYLYIDTGAMYRAAAWLSLAKNVDAADEEQVVAALKASKLELKEKDATSQGRMRVFVDGKEITGEIRTPEVSNLSSAVSAFAGVRKVLVAEQQKLAKGGGVVLEGRDIGTKVLPDAEVKIFLTASPEVRAKRRYRELVEAGQAVNFDELVEDIRTRDHRDTTRALDPLRQAEDAHAVDTDGLTIDQVVASILSICKNRLHAAIEK